MALGSDGFVTVVGDFDGNGGVSVSGKVTFTPSVRIVRGDVTYPQLPVTVLLDEEGKFSIKLPATDDPAVTPNGFTYKVDTAVTAFVNGRAVTDFDSKNVTLSVDDADAQGIAQLSDLLPVPAVGTPTTFLTRLAADARYLLKTDVPELPSNIVTTEQLTSGLSAKVNSSTYTAGLSAKADKSDLTPLATKQYVDTAVANAGGGSGGSGIAYDTDGTPYLV